MSAAANAARRDDGEPHTPRVVRIDRDGLVGFVAIDSTIAGRARGGLRLALGLEEAEIRDAARAMTLKYGLLGLPQGGAKAGVAGDPDAPVEERRARLLAFGRAIEPLLRTRAYVPDADLGTRTEDVRWMMGELGIPIARREWVAGDSGLWTAASTVAAAKAALRAAAPRGLRSLAGATVAIEGFGAVGSSAARLLVAAGARVVAVSTSLGALYDPRGLDLPRLATRRHAGSRAIEADVAAERLPREKLLELPVDLLVPCARRHSIRRDNVERIAAPVICPGANNPIDPEAERALIARGVVSIPDFVANCGGVLGGTMAFAGIDSAEICRFIDDRIARLVAGLLERAAHEGRSLRETTERLALQRRALSIESAGRPRVRDRALAAGLEVYRRGWLPSRLIAAASTRYFDRLLRF